MTLHLRGRQRSSSAAVKYPDSLNPFGSTSSCDNINQPGNSYDEEKNPFSTAEDEEVEERRDFFPDTNRSSPSPTTVPYTPTPAPRKKFLNSLTFDRRRQNGVPAFDPSPFHDQPTPLSRSASLRHPAPPRPLRNGQGDHLRSSHAKSDETDSDFHSFQSRRSAPVPPVRTTSQNLCPPPIPAPSKLLTRSPSLPTSVRRPPPNTPPIRSHNNLAPSSSSRLSPKQPVSTLQTAFKTPQAKEKQRRSLKSLVRAASFSFAVDGNYRDFLDL